MMWSTQKSHDKARKSYKEKQRWRKWFAWYPVSDGAHNWLWLQYVDTKWTPGHLTGCGFYSYREHVDVSQLYYVESAGDGLPCYGRITDRNRQLHQVMFRLDNETRAYWMHEDMVFKAD